MAINLLPLIGLIPWMLYFVYIGLPDIYKILGGSFGFFSLYPIIVYLHYKYKVYRKLLWLFTITLAGLTGINHLYSFSSVRFANIHGLTYVLLVAIPISWIITGIVGGIEIFMRREELKNNEIFRSFTVYCLNIILLPLYCTIILLIKPYQFANSNQYVIQYFLGGLLASITILLILTNRITIEEIEYFVKPIARLDVGINKARKFMMIGIIIILFFSTYWEINRREWLLWLETAGIFILYVFLQFRFAEIIFTPLKSDVSEPIKYNFPSIKSKKSIIIGLILLVVLLVVAIYCQ